MFRDTVIKTAICALLIISVLHYPRPIFAQNKDWNSTSCMVEGVATIQCLVPLFRNAVVAIVELSGIALFIMFIAGGFSFITSGGNPKQLEQAKQTLTYAIIGLVVVVIAFLIIQLISTITGVGGLNQFVIPEANTP